MSFAFVLALTLAAAPVERRAGAVIEDITFASADREIYPSGQTAAYRICPEKKKRRPAGVLFVHWYDPPEKSSNRTQFIEEAVELARSGACSLLIETLWSNPGWFPQRKREQDVAQTEAQLREIRQALAYLRTFADAKKLAYVGHDFGAMAGAAIAPDEPAIRAWALQAGTPQWGNWYLLGWRLESAAEREAIQKRTAHLDPAVRLARAKGAFFLQFGRNDRYVPDDKAREFFQAAPEPKRMEWYGGGHGLDEAARRDRVAWLKLQLGLR